VTRRSTTYSSIIGLTLICFMAMIPSSFADDTTSRWPLVVVNGDTIHSSDLDAELIKFHMGIDKQRRSGFDYEKLIGKLVNDRLLIQEALALELDQNDAMIESLKEQRESRATSQFVRDKFKSSPMASEDGILEYFNSFYSKLQIRTVSVQDSLHAQALVTAVRSGANIDSIAEAHSVDMYRYKGGLHAEKYYGDVESVFRERSDQLKVGEFSDVFPYRQVYAFLKLEKTASSDLKDLPKYRKKIEAILKTRAQDRQWRAFVDSIKQFVPVTIDSAALKEIMANSGDLFTSKFLKNSNKPIVTADSDHFVTDSELRAELSHTASTSPNSSFIDLFIKTLENSTDDLVLRVAARSAGYLDHPKVAARLERSCDSALVQTYLQEMILPRIKFNHKEFEQYYSENQDQFRRPDEFMLDKIIVEDQALADKIVSRLRDGAEFSYVVREYDEYNLSKDDEVERMSLEQFPDTVRNVLIRLRAGESSPAFQTTDGWIVLNVKQRWPGEVKSLEESDMQIRELMFHRKFDELLDETMAVLKENSEIQYLDESIERYFNGMP